MNESGRRLAEFRESRSLSQRELATEIGKSYALVAAVESGNRKLSDAFLYALTERYALNPQWLLTGDGEMYLEREQLTRGRVGTVLPPDMTNPAHGDLRFDGTEFSYVRRMELSVSAGSGVVPVDDSITWGMSLPTRWFSRNRINADLVVMVRVKGDSMTPSIPDGASILVHLAEKIPNRPGVYAFTLEGECYVKRLVPAEPDSHGQVASLVVVADNPAYAPIVLTGQKLADIRVVGKVRAVFTEY